jgi:hypothetical protein
MCRMHLVGRLPKVYPDRNPLEPTLLNMYTKVVLREGSMLLGVSACPISMCFVACRLHIPCLVEICDLLQSSDT